MIDQLDRKILKLLQSDATMSVSSIGEAVGLSHNAAWRRVKRLQEHGVIAKNVIVLDRSKVGVPVTVFVFVKTKQHDEEWLEQFASGVMNIPEVSEFHRLSGDLDYVLKLHVRDIQDYDRVYKKLIKIAPMSDVSSSFSMEELKWTTAIPL